jgi:hypothetical protein
MNTREGKSIWYIFRQIRLKSQSKAVNLSEKLVAEIAESLWVRVMMFNATFNNISVISWRSVLLVEETGVSGENNRPDASHWQTLSHFQWDDDDEVRFVLDQHAELDFYSASSLKQQFAVRHVAPLGHIIENEKNSESAPRRITWADCHHLVSVVSITHFLSWTWLGSTVG